MQEDGSTRVKRVCRWNHNYFVTSLVAHDDRVIIGDAVSSVSVLKVQGSELRTIARDYAPLWPLTVEAVRENGVIGSNVGFHLTLTVFPVHLIFARPTAISSHSRYKTRTVATGSNVTAISTAGKS